MNKKIIISGILSAISSIWTPLVLAENCNDRAGYFEAVKPYNTHLNSETGNSFSQSLCGQNVTINTIGGTGIIKDATDIATNLEDGGVRYTEEVQIMVGDKVIFEGTDFTDEDLDRLLDELRIDGIGKVREHK